MVAVQNAYSHRINRPSAILNTVTVNQFEFSELLIMLDWIVVQNLFQEGLRVVLFLIQFIISILGINKS